MSSQGVSRKRPAPGTSPLVHQQIPSPTSFPAVPEPQPHLSNDQFLQWGQNVPSNPNAVNANAGHYQAVAGLHGDVQNMQALNQLARRPGNNQLVSRRLPDQSMTPLMDQGGVRSREQTIERGQETEAELQQRALLAKKDAQAKRKQIPPFVQKLSSFLEEEKNTDLIRWSDDGNSFIVLDEDEFAKKLIPELFKHNNYASFVRQLNMYGFHKMVGLSDNSMRASERKNKSPSEYSHEYFRRGHPDLLWLIQKRKDKPGHGSKGSKGSARVKSEPEGEEGEHEEGVVEEASGPREERSKFRGQLTLPAAGDESLAQDKLANVYQELQNIRHQQQIISSTIGKLRREHEQLYGQAANFQEQHTRHENSINAILTFLATVYNRSLQGHEGAQGLVNSFAGTIPQDPNQGNIVDVEDYIGSLDSDNSPANRVFKRQPLLLKAPPTGPDGQPLPAEAISPATNPRQYDISEGSRRSTSQTSGLQSGNIEELFDHASPSNQSQPHRQQQEGLAHNPGANEAAPRYPPQRDIMSIIQNSNARNNLQTTQADFPAALSSLENSAGNSPLSAAQRADMLRLIANESTASNPSAANTSANNALITPNPPPMPHNYPSRLANTRAEIDNLVKMQAEQDRSVQNLTNLLQPLSPTGAIPGLDPSRANAPPPLELDQIFNSGDYFSDFPEADKGGSGSGYNKGGQPEQPDNRSGDDKDNTAGSFPGTNDLFDFDSLPDGSVGDIFGDSTATDNHQRPVSGYFDGLNSMPGGNGPGGLSQNVGNNTSGGRGPSGGGLGSEAAKPVNTTNDDNNSNVSSTSAPSPSTKRRRMNQ